jgi:hypothetical protein
VLVFDCVVSAGFTTYDIQKVVVVYLTSNAALLGVSLCGAVVNMSALQAGGRKFQTPDYFFPFKFFNSFSFFYFFALFLTN